MVLFVVIIWILGYWVLFISLMKFGLWRISLINGHFFFVYFCFSDELGYACMICICLNLPPFYFFIWSCPFFHCICYDHGLLGSENNSETWVSKKFGNKCFLIFFATYILESWWIFAFLVIYSFIICYIFFLTVFLFYMWVEFVIVHSSLILLDYLMSFWAVGMSN